MVPTVVPVIVKIVVPLKKESSEVGGIRVVNGGDLGVFVRMFIAICDGGGGGERGNSDDVVMSNSIMVMVMCTDENDGSVTASGDFG